MVEVVTRHQAVESHPPEEAATEVEVVATAVAPGLDRPLPATATIRARARARARATIRAITRVPPLMVALRRPRRDHQAAVAVREEQGARRRACR